PDLDVHVDLEVDIHIAVELVQILGVDLFYALECYDHVQVRLLQAAALIGVGESQAGAVAARLPRLAWRRPPGRARATLFRSGRCAAVLGARGAVRLGPGQPRW